MILTSRFECCSKPMVLVEIKFFTPHLQPWNMWRCSVCGKCKPCKYGRKVGKRG